MIKPRLMTFLLAVLMFGGGLGVVSSRGPHVKTVGDYCRHLIEFSHDLYSDVSYYYDGVGLGKLYEQGILTPEMMVPENIFRSRQKFSGHYHIDALLFIDGGDHKVVSTTTLMPISYREGRNYFTPPEQHHTFVDSVDKKEARFLISHFGRAIPLVASKGYFADLRNGVSPRSYDNRQHFENERKLLLLESENVFNFRVAERGSNAFLLMRGALTEAISKLISDGELGWHDLQEGKLFEVENLNDDQGHRRERLFTYALQGASDIFIFQTRGFFKNEPSAKDARGTVAYRLDTKRATRLKSKHGEILNLITPHDEDSLYRTPDRKQRGFLLITGKGKQVETKIEEYKKPED